MTKVNDGYIGTWPCRARCAGGGGTCPIRQGVSPRVSPMHAGHAPNFTGMGSCPAGDIRS